MNQLHSILEGCLANNPRCQKALYEHYYGFALKIVFRYIYRYEKATDVANDAFVKIFRYFERFECAEHHHLEKILMGWMKRIIINTAIDALRRSNMMAEIGGIPDWVWEQKDDNASADQNLLYKELMKHVKSLPPAYRVVFNMYVIDGYSHAEIAKSMGISVGASKSNLFKARVLLKKYINNDLETVRICNL